MKLSRKERKQFARLLSTPKTVKEAANTKVAKEGYLESIK